MIQFHYLPDWPWLAGAGVLAALLLSFSYALAVGKPKWGLRVGLLTLRWLAIAGVVICLLDPQRVEEIRQQQTAQVAVLVDTSRSMSLKDVPEGRLGSARTWLRPDRHASLLECQQIAFDRARRDFEPFRQLGGAHQSRSTSAQLFDERVEPIGPIHAWSVAPALTNLHPCHPR